MRLRPLLSAVYLNLSFLLSNGCEYRDEPTHVFEYAHFTFQTKNSDKPYWDKVNQKLEIEYGKILAHHGLVSIGRITFYVFSNVAGLRAAMKETFPHIFVPNFATGLAPSPIDVYLVQPSPDYYSVYIHEFTHCVSQHLNPAIPNNPRWLWESIALFEANEFTEPGNINVIVTHSVPPLAALNDINNPIIYQIGYFVGEFVFKTFGKEKYIQLIKENGNTQDVLGLTDDQFLIDWYQFMKSNYQI